MDRFILDLKSRRFCNKQSMEFGMTAITRDMTKKIL
jgi:hypothetical protein